MASSAPRLLFRRRIPLKLPPPPVAARSFHTTTPRHNLNRENNFEEFLKSLPHIKHPFIVKGPVSPICLDPVIVGSIAFLRVDMPGVGKEGIKLWFKEDHLFFDGYENESDKDLRYDKEMRNRRKYEGSFGINEWVKKDRIKASFDNGVLRISLSLYSPMEMTVMKKTGRSW